MQMTRDGSIGQVPRRWAAATSLGLAMLLVQGAAQAQGMGGGGMGGPGGGPPGGGARPPMAQREAPQDIEDLLRPDPGLLWAKLLQVQRNEPAFSALQAPLDALLRELDGLQQLNARRVRQAIRRQPPVASAQVDVTRDLRLAAEDARDWQEALAAVGQRWAALDAGLDAEQRRQLLARYDDAWHGRAQGVMPDKR
jgi:hypothetical protein